MTISYYPSHKHIINQFSSICGQHVGIMESQIIMQANASLNRNVSLCTSRMPNYHKALFGDNTEISYHLSGYGVNREEALIRLLGEGVERYALFTSFLYFKDNIEYFTYNELSKKHPNMVIPWEYIHIYHTDDYNVLSKETLLKDITKDDNIGWILCPSLFYVDKSYYIPAQMMFIGYRANEDKNEKWFTPGFSKGTAAHTNVKKALIGALGEIIESDALMLKWYSDIEAYEVIIDDYDLDKLVKYIMDGLNYDLVVYDYTTVSEAGYVFGVVLISRTNDTPYIVMGCSSGFDPIKAIYRGIMEAIAILYLAINGAVVMPKDYLDVAHERIHTNLDSNVAYWASLDDKEKKIGHLRKIIKGQRPVSSYVNKLEQEGTDELEEYIKAIKKISQYAVYMDMTPVEVVDRGLNVMRVFIPELVQMSFPGVPYSKHPRMLEYGGIKNDLPHPLP